MQRTTLKKVGKRVLQIGLPVVIVGCLLYFVLGPEWKQLIAHPFRWNPWLLLLAFGGFLLQELSYGLIWQAVLARLGFRLALRTSLRIYLASEFVRYIPGNVWHVLTRILWVNKYGVSRPIAFASMTVELITKLAAAACIFACSLLFWSGSGAIRSLLVGKPLLVGLGVALILALLIGLHPRVLSGLLNGMLRLLKRNPVGLTLRYSDILLVTLAWCVSWIIAGSAFYVLLLALWPVPLAALPICIGIYAIAWDIGFLAFLSPGGLGFREGAIAGLFLLALPALPAPLGPVIALLSRFVSTLAELVCVSIAYLAGGKQMRAVQQEQEQVVQLLAPDEGVGREEINASLSAAHISAEEGVIHE